MEYIVKRVEPDDSQIRGYMDWLQGQNRHELGFLSWMALDEAIRRGRVLQATLNGELAGYVIHGKPGQNTRILQTVIQQDARRFEHGTALVEAVKIIANSVGGHKISLHCAEDLEANIFWDALNFSRTGQRLKDKTGKRWQNRYEISLPGAAQALKIAADRRDAAGVSRLHALLCKGDIRLASLDFARHRLSRHTLELGQTPEPNNPKKR